MIGAPDKHEPKIGGPLMTLTRRFPSGEVAYPPMRRENRRPVWTEAPVRRAWLTAKTRAEQCEVAGRPDLAATVRTIRQALAAELLEHAPEPEP
jgi:hypothetical protein